MKSLLCAAVAVGSALFATPSSGPSGALFTTSDGPVRVRNWCYRLQGANGAALNPKTIAAAPHEMAVIDYSRDGTDAGKFTETQVRRMRESDSGWGGDGHRKVVLAYISIGEVEDFRSHWNPSWTSNGQATGSNTGAAPAWLGPVNPDWPDSRKVRYWDSDWQDIIFNDARIGWLDTIVAHGFDGAYLDIVDAYEYWSDEVGEVSALQAARDMIDFVVALTVHARQTNPNFLIVPQNAPGILKVVRNSDPTRYQEYLEAISAIAAEDLYFYGNHDENNNFNPENYAINWLKTDFAGNDVPVFVVDYVNTNDRRNKLCREAIGDGFYPHAAPSRELDVIGPRVPGHFYGDYWPN